MSVSSEIVNELINNRYYTKTTKTQAITALEAVLNEIGDSATWEVRENLKKALGFMYSGLTKVSATKKFRNPIDWMWAHRSDQDIREFLKLGWVSDKGEMVTSNGYTMVILDPKFTPTDLKRNDAFLIDYDKHIVSKEADTNSFDQTIKGLKETFKKMKPLPKDSLENPELAIMEVPEGKKTSLMKFCIGEDKVIVNSDFFDKANCQPNASWYYDDTKLIAKGDWGTVMIAQIKE